MGDNYRLGCIMEAVNAALSKVNITPGRRAEFAIAANPGASDRALADETGIDRETISRARQRIGILPDARLGKDGIARRMPRKAPSSEFADAAPRGPGQDAPNGVGPDDASADAADRTSELLMAGAG